MLMSTRSFPDHYFRQGLNKARHFGLAQSSFPETQLSILIASKGVQVPFYCNQCTVIKSTRDLGNVYIPGTLDRHGDIGSRQAHAELIDHVAAPHDHLSLRLLLCSCLTLSSSH